MSGDRLNARSRRWAFPKTWGVLRELGATPVQLRPGKRLGIVTVSREMPPVWIQRELALPTLDRGFHLITDQIEELAELGRISVGIAHLFLRHTSAALALNENASAAVLRDLARWFDEAVPEDAAYWTHTAEGPDDMPAHVKATLLGSAVTIPVSQGRLALGAWQGVYLCELRNRGGPRRLVITLFGESSTTRS